MGKLQNKKNQISRRHFIQSTSAAAMAFAVNINCGLIGVQKPMTRPFGKLNFDVTTLGLGGQSSLQWTPRDVDPMTIILKAFNLGVNYFDTSNLYGPSQNNYGKAFKTLELVPGSAGYNENLRRSIFVTSKTRLRWARNNDPNYDTSWFTNGVKNSFAIDDLKRTISQLYGDGQGNYPRGAYIDMILIHSLDDLQDVDVLYQGLDDPTAPNIGALVALVDYRDGTNLTGLNPGEEKLIRHIGFSGHSSPAVMMEMIQRDTNNIIDAMLVAINSNDKLYFNMQNNVIPVAAAKNMGIIGMKVFADGAMYTKDSRWSRQPEDVVRTVGSTELPSRPLVEYTLSTPGVHTAIIGIGQIDKNPKNCQLAQNLSSAQIKAASLSDTERAAIERMTSQVKAGKTNYFQNEGSGLTAPRDVNIVPDIANKMNRIVSWNSAYAGQYPLKAYEVWKDNKLAGKVDHYPQISKVPMKFTDTVADKNRHTYKLVSVDVLGNKAESEQIIL